MRLVAERPDQYVHFEHNLIGIQTDLPVSGKDRAIISAYYQVLADVTPIDVLVFQADGYNVGQRVIDAAPSVKSGQDIALSMRFLAHNFTDKKVSLLRLHRARRAPSNNLGGRCAIAYFHAILEKGGVSYVRGRKVDICERRAAFAVDKKAVPGEADVSTGK